MTVMSATPQLPSDLLLWRARQRSGDQLPWDDLGIRFLEDDDLPALLDTSYLDEDDLADPGIRANVAAMAETNALIVWVAEEEDGAVFGYWAGPDGLPVPHGFADAVVVTLDTEGQYMVLPGRNITEALCAHASDFDDDAFVRLAARARDLAAETDAETAADLIEADALAALPTRAIEGPGRFRDVRFTALRAQEEEHREGRDRVDGSDEQHGESRAQRRHPLPPRLGREERQEDPGSERHRPDLGADRTEPDEHPRGRRVGEGRDDPRPAGPDPEPFEDAPGPVVPEDQ